MDWTWLSVVPDDEDFIFVLLVAAVLGVSWWQVRRWGTERKQPKIEKEWPLVEHRFEGEAMLNCMQCRRASLFKRHRAPPGHSEAPVRRVAAARAKLLEQDLLHDS